MAKVTSNFDVVEEAIRQLSPDKPNQGFDMVDGIPVPEDRSVARFEIDTPDDDRTIKNAIGGLSPTTGTLVQAWSDALTQMGGTPNTFDRNQIKPPTADEIAKTPADVLLGKTVRPEDAELILTAKAVEAGITDPQAQQMIVAKGMTAFKAGKNPIQVLNSAATGIEDFVNDTLERVNNIVGPIYTKGEDFITETIDTITAKVPWLRDFIPNQGTIVNTSTGTVTGTYTAGGAGIPPWLQTGTGGITVGSPRAGGGIWTAKRGPIVVSTGNATADKILGKILKGGTIDLENVATQDIINTVLKEAGIDPTTIGGNATGKVVKTAVEKTKTIIKEANKNNKKLKVTADDPCDDPTSLAYNDPTICPKNITYDDPCDDPTSLAYNDPTICPKNITGGQDTTDSQIALQDLTCWNANGQSQDFKQVASCPDTFPFTSNPFDADGAPATVPITGKGDKPCDPVNGVEYKRDDTGNCVPVSGGDDKKKGDKPCDPVNGVEYKRDDTGNCVPVSGGDDKKKGDTTTVDTTTVATTTETDGCGIVNGVQYVEDANGNCVPPAVGDDKCENAVYAANHLCECFPEHPDCGDPCEELKDECAKIGQCADCDTMQCMDCPPVVEKEEEEVVEIGGGSAGAGSAGGGGLNFGFETPPQIPTPSPVTEEAAELVELGPQYSISGKPLFETQQTDDLDFLGLESNPFAPFNKGGIVRDYAVNTLIDILRKK